MQQPRLIRVTQEQLDLFNQHFQLALDRKTCESFDDYKVTLGDFKNESLKEIDFKDAKTYREDTYEKYYITQGTQGLEVYIKELSDISDIENFILNEMQNYL